MGVEWSSWKMTRSPFGRKNCVYFIGGRTGAPFDAGAGFEAAFLLCASAGTPGANTSAANTTAARRFQNIFTPPRVFGWATRARTLRHHVAALPARHAALRVLFNTGNC